MKLNPKQKLKRNWGKLQQTAGDIKKKMSGPVKNKADKWLGRWIHKEIATLFIWDEHVQGWVFGGTICSGCLTKNREKHDECQRCGDTLKDGNKFKGIVELAGTNAAIRESKRLKRYIIHKANRNRKYQKKMDEVGEKLKEKQGELKSKFENLKDKRFLNWLKEGD